VTGETIELRVLFPTSIVPDGKKIVPKDMLEEIMNNEAIRAKEANRKRIMGSWSMAGSLTWIALSIALFIFLYVKYEKTPHVDLYEREIQQPPGNLSPALASHIVQPGLVPAVSITAEIVALAKKGYLILTPYTVDSNDRPLKGKKPKYRMIRKSPGSQDGILNYQKFMLDWFFNKIGNGSSVTFEEIAKYSRKNANSFRTDLSRWKGMIEGTAQSMGIKREKTPSWKIGLGFFIISIFVGLAVGIFVGAWFFTVLASVLSGIVFLISSSFKKLSYQGAVEKARWIAYIKYLKDICKNKKEDIHTLSRWEDIFPYAIAFNFSKSAIKHIEETFPDSAFNNPDLVFFYSYGLNRPHRRINDFAVSVNSIMANFSSASGTGGGSSSSGGGGGGGAF